MCEEQCVKFPANRVAWHAERGPSQVRVNRISYPDTWYHVRDVVGLMVGGGGNYRLQRVRVLFFFVFSSTMSAFTF